MLSYGSGADPDPLLDVTDETPTYATTYTLTAPTEGSDALNAFNVIRQQKISGAITLEDSFGTAIDGLHYYEHSAGT